MVTYARKRVAFVGPATSGKSFACNICIDNFGGVKASFAAPVKQEVFTFLQDFRKYLGLMKMNDMYPDVMFKDARPNIGYMSLPPLEYDDPIGWVNHHKTELRPLLQWWGTSYRRGQDKQYWIKKMIPILKEYENVFIDDCRFINEADFLVENGFVLIGIEPISLEKGIDYNHPSEMGVYDIWNKYGCPIIKNDKQNEVKFKKELLTLLGI